MSNNESASNINKGPDFIRAIVAEDNANGKYSGRVHTRFPPEPNGYLHIGHAKSICLNFGVAAENNGKCNLRFDDTNPLKEDVEYVESIKEDVNWLGFQWDGPVLFASDYFEQLYQFAVQLIKDGKAYVDELSADEIREFRGTLTQPGKHSPYRDRDPKESLDLFERMRAGEFADGAMVLRAKIDMSSPNMVMRDPTICRIRKAHHHRTGDDWCIYPMYDFTHCISDSLEKITHSLCTLEFVNNRELYDWILENLNLYRSYQYEFARLNLTYTLLSKRVLIQLVQEGIVNGWDDPRMPTIRGIRRLGYTPEAIRDFCARIGIAKGDSLVDWGLLEFCLREHLNEVAPRAMGVLNPLKLVIENYPDDQVEEFNMPLHPEDDRHGSRIVPFSKVLYIEQEDFREDPPKKFFRLAPGKEVRLRYAYYVTCTEVIKDDQGNVIEVRCTYDPATKGGWSEDGRKVKGTLHWVSAKHAVPAEVRLYDHLFAKEVPAQVEEGKTFRDNLNPNSLVKVNAFLEPYLASLNPLDKVQFERLGYFCMDLDSTPEKLVFNRTVGLRDTWAKIEKNAE